MRDVSIFKTVFYLFFLTWWTGTFQISECELGSMFLPEGLWGLIPPLLAVQIRDGFRALSLA